MVWYCVVPHLSSLTLCSFMCLSLSLYRSLSLPPVIDHCLRRGLASSRSPTFSQIDNNVVVCAFTLNSVRTLIQPVWVASKTILILTAMYLFAVPPHRTAILDYRKPDVYMNASVYNIHRQPTTGFFLFIFLEARDLNLKRITTQTVLRTAGPQARP